MTQEHDRSLAAPAASPPPPTFPFLAPPRTVDELGRLGPYRILGVLGTGGMGVVFRAEDPALRRYVALKVMRPEVAHNVTSRTRFTREARSQAAVEHDHVAAIFQVGEDRGVPYIAMPLLRGMTLAAALKANPAVPIPEAVRIAREVAEGLAAAHERGLIHRDIKPANVWLEGNQRRVKLLDFGLARETATEAEGGEPVTHEGGVVGTPAYMSPEQGRGERVDVRTDLWSLGVILHQMLAQELPFKGQTLMAVLTSLAMDTPPPVSERNPAVPPVLAALVSRLMSKSCEARPRTATEVVEQLRAIEAGLAQAALPVVLYAPPAADDPWTQITAGETEADAEQTASELPQPTERITPPRPRRSWGMLVGSVVLLVAAVGIAVAVLMFGDRKPAAPTPEDVTDASTKSGRGPVPNPGKTPLPRPVTDREAAELVLRAKGRVFINGKSEEIQTVAGLPEESFVLTGVLFMHSPKVSDVELRQLAGLLQITTLVILECENVTDAGLVPFRECKNLLHLQVISAPLVTDSGLENFASLTSLISLYLSGPQLSDRGLAVFKNNVELRDLQLSSPRITNEGLKAFANTRDLQHLRIVVSPQVTGEGLEKFKENKQLRSLELDQTGIAAAGLAWLKGCESLSSLALGGKLVTEEVLDQLPALPGLMRLRLTGEALTDAGLAKLRGRRGIRFLSVGDAPNVTDAGFGHLANFTAIEELTIAACPAITDATLGSFQDLSKLTHLNLEHCPRLTDACLLYLAGCERLLGARFSGTKLTPEGLARFAEKHPRCRIFHNGSVIEPKK